MDDPVLAPPPAAPPAVEPPGAVVVAPLPSFIELPDVPPCTGTPVEGGGTVVEPLLVPLLVVGLLWLAALEFWAFWSSQAASPRSRAGRAAIRNLLRMEYRSSASGRRRRGSPSRVSAARAPVGLGTDLMAPCGSKHPTAGFIPFTLVLRRVDGWANGQGGGAGDSPLGRKNFTGTL
ncbi:hypothetical protein AZL_015230 [Azospirillum sp. B510]|nr:hypothetical protein AZL_015230 [Azospirillum sp. B510]